MAFTMQLHRPRVAQPVPVIVSGDTCWRYINDDVHSSVLSGDMALATFNRVEIAADAPTHPTSHPTNHTSHTNLAANTLAHWAWTYQRCIDALCQMPEIDKTRLAITGHSRGGKAALLAGATDERISLTHANNSGLAGSGSFHVLASGSETLADMLRQFPHWLGPQTQTTQKIPATWDQDLLLSMIAPRHLLITQAQDDAWANPMGTRHVLTRAAAHFERLNASAHLHQVWRTGGHANQLDDWLALLQIAKFV